MKALLNISETNLAGADWLTAQHGVLVDRWAPVVSDPEPSITRVGQMTHSDIVTMSPDTAARLSEDLAYVYRSYRSMQIRLALLQANALGYSGIAVNE